MAGSSPRRDATEVERADAAPSSWCAQHVEPGDTLVIETPAAADTGPAMPAPGTGGSARDTLTLCDRDAAAGVLAGRRLQRHQAVRGLFIAQTPAGHSGGAAATITHLFGQTVIKEPQARGQRLHRGRTTLAVDVVPIAVTDSFGDQPFAVWPWAAPKLGRRGRRCEPGQRDSDHDRIAALKPDDRGDQRRVDADTYPAAVDSPRPSPSPAATHSRGRTRPGRSAEAAADRMRNRDRAVDQVRRGGAAASALAGQKALLLQGRLGETNVVATLAGWRTGSSAAWVW